MNSPYEQLAAEYESPRNVTITMTEQDAAVYLRRHGLYRILQEAHALVRSTWKHGSEMRLDQLYSLLCEACAVFEEGE